jgi:hypothetical protein
MELWWNDTDREKLKNSEKNLFLCHFVLNKSHMECPAVNLGLCGEKPVNACAMAWSN